MRESPDIQSAVDAVLRNGRLTEVPPATPGSRLGLFDGEERDVLVQGDLACVDVVRGQGAILVQGSVLGTAEHPLRLEAKGDVVVTGSVQHAQLQGDSVLIGGNTTGARITAARRVVVAGQLDGGRVVAGDYEDIRRRVESCRLSLDQAQVQCEDLARRVTADEKRLDKTCSALRNPLDFNVGRIVQHANGRVAVDLSSFYGSLEGRTEEQLELALGEFFAKGIIGVITRANRKYLVNLPAREKVFMQLVKGLRELFAAVLERDRLTRRVAWLEQRLEQMVESLARRQAIVEVAGGIAGAAEMEFILPRVVRPPKQEDGYDFVHKTARLLINSGSGGVASVVSRGTDGESTSSTLPASELEGLRFSVADGRVLFAHAGDAVGV